MKKRNLFMASTIFCALFIVAFTFKADQIDWLWTDHKPVAIVFGVLTIIFIFQWLKHQRLLGKSKQ
jgi:hypothetical protein